ncbi:hypothetical protein F53441_11783 [Fusarium austroafricanum]|uniref:Extracellular membrane protein CFEM domain-containing protein n=1 Tax=Fusarium austroafricanum TaxID=2364996 RepID=A0A8H4K225_9HYPO|nr:hypothetical protein F53441_11783 [Fusarium austroafricanum]
MVHLFNSFLVLGLFGPGLAIVIPKLDNPAMLSFASAPVTSLSSTESVAVALIESASGAAGEVDGASGTIWARANSSECGKRAVSDTVGEVNGASGIVWAREDSHNDTMPSIELAPVASPSPQTNNGTMSIDQTEQFNRECDNTCLQTNFPGGDNIDNCPNCMCTQSAARDAYFCCLAKVCHRDVFHAAIRRHDPDCSIRSMPFSFDVEKTCGVQLEPPTPAVFNLTHNFTLVEEWKKAPIKIYSCGGGPGKRAVDGTSGEGNKASGTISPRADSSQC